MDNLTLVTLAKLLGAFFYYSPNSETVRPLIDGLLHIDNLANWSDYKLINEQCQILANQIQTPDLDFQFSVLFEGQGNMPVPPWGSVYLDQEKLLMGESQERYRQFLQQNGLTLNSGMNEPEDQFGLMLMAFAILVEKKQFVVAKQLMTDHLLLWSSTYLNHLKQNEISLFYQALAVITEQYLQMLLTSI
ncbi:molecular chaperone [Gilliamella sp. B2776]|uniref:TorD/DmsD family molecular chaperone n=1 Tax=unclassified Gilliamella TaxID=2685620 RepID=UPI00226A8E4A|nr:MULTISPECIES: molecular chaperone [unclassified Gilliamella]MCX8650923.1 molecular chaperone [Gilliamella sp. B2779]MCX8654006.1 molecular chaperone [Gilliamella sp. B2737]MCX8657324.1 molecular chaperone [Gilliamella sp. B2894]MCX8665932.1 molecular chaperone [Gilliamella sp. B2887]MCX8692737.1 molecular chaperone [Gilliamella sp. B2776]